MVCFHKKDLWYAVDLFIGTPHTQVFHFLFIATTGSQTHEEKIAVGRSGRAIKELGLYP